jgi:hypothetical protein
VYSPDALNAVSPESIPKYPRNVVPDHTDTPATGPDAAPPVNAVDGTVTFPPDAVHVTVWSAAVVRFVVPSVVAAVCKRTFVMSVAIAAAPTWMPAVVRPSAIAIS